MRHCTRELTKEGGQTILYWCNCRGLFILQILDCTDILKHVITKKHHTLGHVLQEDMRIGNCVLKLRIGMQPLGNITILPLGNIESHLGRSLMQMGNQYCPLLLLDWRAQYGHNHIAGAKVFPLPGWC